MNCPDSSARVVQCSSPSILGLTWLRSRTATTRCPSGGGLLVDVPIILLLNGKQHAAFPRGGPNGNSACRTRRKGRFQFFSVGKYRTVYTAARSRNESNLEPLNPPFSSGVASCVNRLGRRPSSRTTPTITFIWSWTGSIPTQPYITSVWSKRQTLKPSFLTCSADSIATLSAYFHSTRPKNGPRTCPKTSPAKSSGDATCFSWMYRAPFKSLSTLISALITEISSR